MKAIVLPLIVVFCSSASVGFAQTFTSGDWTYELNDANEATIIGYSGPGGAVDIPGALDGNPVKQVGNVGSPIFGWGGASVNSVVIPDSVTSIGDQAFLGVGSLTNVSIGSSVTNISFGAFMQCTSLSSIVIPDSVVSIGNSAFQDCTSLTNVVIGSGVTNMSWGVFQNCPNLVSVVFAPGTAAIPSSALSGVTSLTSVVIPDTVVDIGEYAFTGCAGLTTITIPERVTNIGAFAFEGCTSLADVALPFALTRIGEWAFSGCSSLTSVTFPQGVTDIGNAAFMDCLSLSNATLPNGVTNIGYFAFSSTGLTEIIVPESVVWLGSEAFIKAPITNAVIPPKFVAQFGYIGLTPEISKTLLLEALTNDYGIATKADLGAAVSDATSQAIAQVQAAPNDYNLFSAAQYEENRTNGQTDVVSQPNTFGLFDSTQYQANRITGVAEGKAEVTSNPTAYDLFTESSIMDMNLGGLMLKKGADANELDLELTIETKDSLIDNEWQVAERIARKVSMDGVQRQFLRVRADAPYVAPNVKVLAHPTLGNILTDGAGRVLYYFAADSPGGNPLFSGASWPYVTVPEAPKADAGVSATLASSTFGKPGGPYLTVNARPVYTYVGDAEAGQANGHGAGSVWWTIRADGVTNQ